MAFGRLAAQSHQWVRTMGGPWLDGGASIALDQQGHVYATGTCQDTADFDPGPGVFELAPPVFVTKFDPLGGFEWAAGVREVGGGSTYANAIAVDPQGNVIVAGGYTGTTIFGSGPDADTLYAHPAWADFFVWKLSTNGDHIWAIGIGGTEGDAANAVAVDTLGRIHVGGSFKETVDFDPGPGIQELVSEGEEDLFILKLDGDGQFIWVKHFGGAWPEHDVRGLIVDDQGSVYSTGTFYGITDFDPAPNEVFMHSEGEHDAFIAKLDSAGILVWVRTFGGPGNDMGMDITMDGAGNIYATGRFYANAEFNPGPDSTFLSTTGGDDAFAIQLDANGDLQWARSVGGGPHVDVGWSIGIDGASHVIIAGSFQVTDPIDSVDFDPGPDEFLLASNGWGDVFVWTLTTSGVFVSAVSVGGLDMDFGADGAVDDYGGIYVNGNYKGEVDFDPGTGIDLRVSAMEHDIFIWKLGSGSSGMEHFADRAAPIVFPNPGSDLLHIRLSDGSDIDRLMVRDMSGRLVAVAQGGRGATDLDISHLAAGTYLLDVGTSRQVHRLCFQKH